MITDFFCPHCHATNFPGSTACSFCTYNFPTTPLAQIWPVGSPTLLKQRYQIIAKLGHGGFAAVYKVQDLQLPSTFRAIKEMDDNLLSPQEKQKAVLAFQQEAQILARLTHPNLPRIHDYFEEQQHWYLVMDYIDGETLESALVRSPQGKLPVEKVILYALQLCTVLNYLHTQMPPIIFRDLKPSNILITPDDHLYLIDFGIARFFKPGQERDTNAFGTYGYAAPEQFGKTQTTPQADIYSFGATLHQLLSGRDPSGEPFIFPPLQLEPRNAMTQAFANLVMRMVAMEKEKRPVHILEIQQALFTIAQWKANQTKQSQPIVVSPRSQTINVRHTRLSSSGIRSQGCIKWAFDASSPVASSPAVVNGAVYFGSYAHNFYALDASSGQQKWSFTAGSYVLSSPTVVNGVVYFGSHDGHLYALDASSGSRKWSFPTGGVVYSSPTVVNGTVYFGSADGHLYALDASSGSQKWSFSTDGRVSSSPTKINGVVYFGSDDGHLYAVEAASGRKKWSFSTGKEVHSSPTVVNGSVYFGSADGHLYALDTSSGQYKWSFSTGNKVDSSPTVANNVVYYGSDDHNVYAVDALSGRQKWAFRSGNVVYSSPTVVNNVVYFGSGDHNLYALDTVSGQQVGTFQTGGWIQASPTVVNDVVYIGSNDGKLYAIFA